MNREIKFRAWDDLNKKWLLGYELPNLGGFSMMGEVMAFGEYSAMLNSFTLEDWDNIKIMQYTGLKDKNGKEIYEGDIWKYDDSKIPYEVYFTAGRFQTNSGYNVKFGVVIGNIYENPELITP